MKKLLSILIAMLMLGSMMGLSASAEEAAVNANPFTDVAEDSYYHDAVIWALENDITTGVTDTLFQPDATTTRGQVVTFLWRGKGCPEPATVENPFTDVAEDSPYYKAILWAYEQNITQGTSETTFDPDGLCTNAHVVTFLWRSEEMPSADGESALAVEYPEQYFTDAIAWAECGGLLAGILAFVPDEESPRANIVTYLYRNLAKNDTDTAAPVLLYMGQASVRIVTPEGKVIYVDPYSGDGYDLAADLILITHGHSDHNKPELIENRNEDCQIITHEESIIDGVHQSFDLGYVMIEAVEAENKNHNINECVGYILTFSNGKSVYLSGDTSTTKQMSELAEKNIDYAFFCCDGKFNMDREEASACAELVGAKYNIPYHMAPGAPNNFDRSIAEEFQAENRIIVEAGEELEIK